MFWLFFCLTLSEAVRGQCPEDLANIPNAAFSPSAGCIWADADESHIDNFEEAVARCRDVFGPEGRLMEIQSAEDQELAVEVMKAAEGMFTVAEPELSYWWSGLMKGDDGLWVWSGSNTPLSYTNWHPAAVPDAELGCMQFLSGTAYEGEAGFVASSSTFETVTNLNNLGKWMTFSCKNDFLSTHAFCQLK